MICQNCLKNQSNYHFTKIINGNKTEYHLCESCAREKGDIIQGPGNSFSIHNLLSGMLNIEFGSTASQVKETDHRCGTCGMTFSQFSKKGRFGCANCYEAFSSRLEPVIRRVQSNNMLHVGKFPRKQSDNRVVPETQSLEQQIAALEKELQEEIQNEHYERAAVLRDRLNQMRKQLRSQGASETSGPGGNVTYKQWTQFDSGEGV